MNWYYASGGQQKGPISDMEFTNLVRDGSIQAKTLIWREGQAEWQPLDAVRPDLLIPVNSPAIGGVPVAETNKDLLVQQLREGAMLSAPGVAPTGLPFAGFWIRLAARLIDGVLLNIVFYAVGFTIFGATIFAIDPAIFESEEPPAGFLIAYFGFIFLWILATVAYTSIMTWKWGGTLGKLAVGIKVVDADGKPITLGRSVGRAFADMLNGFACFLTYLMPAFDEQKRALHDHICATRVVQRSGS